jgi:hypothetical protein
MYTVPSVVLKGLDMLPVPSPVATTGVKVLTTAPLFGVTFVGPLLL